MTKVPKGSTGAGVSRRPRLDFRLSLALLACLGCAVLATTAPAASAARGRSLYKVPPITASAATAAGGRSPYKVPARQQLAVLEYGHRAFASPHTTAHVQTSVSSSRPITGERTTLPVLGQTVNRDGQRWLKVRLPGRPNSSTGWIKRSGTREQSTAWNIQVSRSRRHVWVYYDGRLARNFSAVVGKPSTPTPSGRFFVEESLIMPVSEPGGPYALALSARSNVLQEFDGGPGEIALHGRDGLGGTLGQAQSHGCVRLATSDITWLAARIVPGTPVTIR
jgi:lipoprotein-anchoring transpeptidase ErfK/SrfK